MKQQYAVKLITEAKAVARSTALVYADSQEEANAKALKQARSEALGFVVDALEAEVDYDGVRLNQGEFLIEDVDVLDELPDLHS